MTRITSSPFQIATWLDSGYQLRPGQFTFSVPGPTSIWPGYGLRDEPNLPGFALPDANMAAAFIDAIGLWDDLIAPDFVQRADNTFTRGELRIAITDTSEDQAAFAYFPSFAGGKPGDIWFSAENDTVDWEKGGFDFHTLLHEIGHTLGLDHSFASPAAPAELDSVRFTLMSYDFIEDQRISFGYEDGDFFAYFASPFAQTPMVIDIAAIQTIYGADRETRAGDTVYSFDDLSRSLSALYDAGGLDTLDLSSVTFANRVDLEPGAYSSIGLASVAEQQAYWIGLFPAEAEFIRFVFTEHLPETGTGIFRFEDNLGIALGTVIENVTGGSGRDVIYGNAAANALLGGRGNDFLVGLSGPDSLEGGEGDDILFGDTEFVKPAGLASGPPPPVQMQPPVPIEPAPVESGGGGSGTSGGGGLRLTITISAAMQLTGDLGHNPLAAPELAEAPRAALRLTLVAADTSLPATASEATDPEPQSPNETPGVTPDPAPKTADPAAFDDTLIGGDGNDALWGGAGRDYMLGGQGADLFGFADGHSPGVTAALADVVGDFNGAEGDRIDLSAIDAIAGGTDDAFRFIGNSDFSGAGGELRVVTTAEYLLLQADTTGDGIADFAIRLDSPVSYSAGALIV